MHKCSASDLLARLLALRRSVSVWLLRPATRRRTFIRRALYRWPRFDAWIYPDNTRSDRAW
jgi:hypothetical protein